MLKILPQTLIYPSVQGHYGFHYPDWKNPAVTRNSAEIEAEPLPFICSDNRNVKAYKITEAQAKVWGLPTVVWMVP